MHSRFSKSPPLSPIFTSQVAIRSTWSPCFVLCVLGSPLKTFPALDNGLFFPQSWYTNRLCSWTTCHGGPLRLQGSTHSIHTDISNWPFFPTAQPPRMLVRPVGVLDSEIKSGVKSASLQKLRTQCWGWLCLPSRNLPLLSWTLVRVPTIHPATHWMMLPSNSYVKASLPKVSFKEVIKVRHGHKVKP